MSAADDLAKGLLDMAGTMAPMVEFAEGQKAELERRGWSPTAAETYALELLLGMTRLAFPPQAPKR